MRICLISQEYPPETGFGGIGTYTYNLAHGLTDLGHHVSVITKAIRKEKSHYDKKVRVYRIFDRKVPFRGFTKILNLITFRGFGYYWHSFSVFKRIEEITRTQGKFDVIEGPLWDGECIAYSRKMNTPLVVRLQTPIFKSREILQEKPDYVLELIERLSLRKAILIASISRNIKNLIVEKYKLDPGRILLSQLAVCLPRVKKPLFKKNSYKLLYVGRLEKRKGTQELINAIQEILKGNEKIKIDIVGKDCFQAPGNISYIEYFKKIVPRKLQSNVRFHGFVEKEKLKVFYRKCDVFIAPSRYESFGLIFLEAMAYGKPVIGTNVGGIPEILIDKKIGYLIDVNNSHMIADSVLKLFANELLRKKMGAFGFKHVRKNFTVQKLVESTLKIYKQAETKFYE